MGELEFLGEVFEADDVLSGAVKFQSENEWIPALCEWKELWNFFDLSFNYFLRWRRG